MLSSALPINRVKRPISGRLVSCSAITEAWFCAYT
jgi:hypothetical protein